MKLHRISNAGIGLAAALALAGGALVGSAGIRPAAAGPAGRLCLLAASGKITSQVRAFTSSECYGGKGIEVPSGVNPKPKEGEARPKLEGDCTLKFKVAQAGQYKLWGRCWWRDGCGNSFLVSIDGSDPIEMSTGNYKRWHWVPVGPLFKLSAGVHTLKIANSEDGAKLDAVFLTSNIGRVPVGRIEQLTPQALVR